MNGNMGQKMTVDERGCTSVAATSVKVWSDEARAAALAARRGNKKPSNDSIENIRSLHDSLLKTSGGRRSDKAQQAIAATWRVREMIAEHGRNSRQAMDAHDRAASFHREASEIHADNPRWRDLHSQLFNAHSLASSRIKKQLSVKKP